MEKVYVKGVYWEKGDGIRIDLEKTGVGEKKNMEPLYEQLEDGTWVQIGEWDMDKQREREARIKHGLRRFYFDIDRHLAELDGISN